MTSGPTDADAAFDLSAGRRVAESSYAGTARLREWAFGGVTRTLIGESGINRFMSY